MKIIIVIGIILTIAILTNPDKQVHIQAVKELFSEKLNEAMVNGVAESSNEFQAAGAAIGATLGLVFVDRILENLVFRDNYLFFSLTEVRYGSNKRIIGIGIFGNVWIVGEVKNLINQSLGK